MGKEYQQMSEDEATSTVLRGGGLSGLCEVDQGLLERLVGKGPAHRLSKREETDLCRALAHCTGSQKQTEYVVATLRVLRDRKRPRLYI